MNRIVLIGNGFDLAHGLKTSYGDFIDWLWHNQAKEIGSNKRDIYNTEFINCKGLPSYRPEFEDCSNYKDLVEELNSSHSTLSFKNKFLEVITKQRESSWVDIESTYYHILIEIVKLKKGEIQTSKYQLTE